MAHSYDRTLLASLGFADPDKATERHDQMCRYLAYGVPGELLKLCGVSGEHPVGKTEQMLCKGEGQYKTTIGFLDVVVRGDSMFVDNKGQAFWHCDKQVIAEVKCHRISVGNILRQLNLYRGFYSGSLRTKWCVATAFDLNDSESAQLTREGIHWLRISTLFDEWLEQQSQCSSQSMTYI